MKYHQRDRFEEKSEIKAKTDKVGIFDEEYEKGGAPVLFEKQNMYLDTSEAHSLVIGTSGCGKTNWLMLLMLTLIRATESMVILDLKQELYNQFHEELKRQGYKVHLINMRNLLSSERINVLEYIYNLYKSGKPSDMKTAMENLDSLANEITKDPEAREKYWSDSAKQLFMALCEALFIAGRPEQIHLFNVYYMLEKGSEKLGMNTCLQIFLKEIIGQSTTACINGGVYTNNADVTRNAIESVLRRGLSNFIGSEVLKDTFSNNGFDISSIDNEKTTTFIVVPDEATTYHKHAGLFIKQIYQQYLALAHEKYNGRLPRRVNFIMEEFGNIKIDDAPTMFSAVRSRNIRMHCVLQSFAQLEQYGPQAKIIKDNCANWLYFYTPDIKTLEELSKRCGERRVDVNGQPSTKPLLSITDLQGFELGQGLFLGKGGTKYVTKIPHVSKCGIKEPKEVELEERELEEICLFDVEEFVKDYKREKFAKLTSSLKSPVEDNSNENISAKKNTNESSLRPKRIKYEKFKEIFKNEKSEDENDANKGSQEYEHISDIFAREWREELEKHLEIAIDDEEELESEIDAEEQLEIAIETDDE